MIDYKKRLVELDEIFNYLSEEDLNKIPEKIRNAIKENKDKEYFWEYDETKPLKEQAVNRDTIALLSYINMEYLLNEEQKKLMQQIHEMNEKKLEDNIELKYDIENLFKENKMHQEEIKAEATQQIIIPSNLNMFQKIFNKIKEFFRKS